MAKIRDLLKQANVETAGARRKCHRRPKQHSIQKGEKCLAVRESDGRGKKNYCGVCAAEILDVAATRLDSLRLELGLDGEPTSVLSGCSVAL